MTEGNSPQNSDKHHPISLIARTAQCCRKRRAAIEASARPKQLAWPAVQHLAPTGTTNRATIPADSAPTAPIARVVTPKFSVHTLRHRNTAETPHPTQYGRVFQHREKCGREGSIIAAYIPLLIYRAKCVRGGPLLGSGSELAQPVRHHSIASPPCRIDSSRAPPPQTAAAATVAKGRINNCCSNPHLGTPPSRVGVKERTDGNSSRTRHLQWSSAGPRHPLGTQWRRSDLAT